MLILGTLCGLLINLEQAQIKARFPFMPIFVFCFLFFFSPGFLHWILHYSKSLVACGLELTQLIKYLIIE